MKLSVLLAIIFVGALSSAQTCESQFIGKLLDPDSNPTAGRVIAYINGVKTVVRVASSGDFSLPITPGTGIVSAEADGLSSKPKSIRLNCGKNELTINLAILPLQQAISVTAEATPQPVDESGKNVSIVDFKDLEARNEFSVAEGLRNVPGVFTQNLGGPGQFSTIRMRGLRADATAILVDGLRFRDAASIQADASGFVSNLNIINLEHVEVLHGSGSSLYGTNAVGGAINLISRQEAGPTRFGLLAEGGQLGLLRGRATVGGGTENGRFIYSGGLLHLNVLSGIDGNDRNRSTGGQAFTRYSFGRDFTLSARFYGSDDFVQPNVGPSASSLPTANFNAPIVPGRLGVTFVAAQDDPDYRRASRFGTTAFILQQQINPRAQWQIAYQHNDTRRVFRDGPGGPGFQTRFNNSSRFNGDINTLDARVTTLLAPWLSITGGYELEHESYLNQDNDGNPNPTQLVAVQTQVTQKANAAYFRAQLTGLKRRLQISLSGRTQGFALSRPNFVYTGTANNYDGANSVNPPRAWTGDIAVAYTLAASTKVRAHWGNAYRAPGLYERFGSGFFFSQSANAVLYSPYGDPRLAPDRYHSVDFGVDQYVGQRIRLSATYFYTRVLSLTAFDFSTAIVNPTNDPFGRFSGYYNSLGAIARGLEFSSEARLSRKNLLRAAYTYTDSRTDRDQTVRGVWRQFNQPKNIFAITAQQTLGRKTNLALDIHRTGSLLAPYFTFVGNRAVEYAGFLRTDLVASHEIWSSDQARLEGYVKLENLFDRTFFESGYRAPGLVSLGGLRVNW
jgi:vitamin B12 transporter